MIQKKTSTIIQPPANGQVNRAYGSLGSFQAQRFQELHDEMDKIGSVIFTPKDILTAGDMLSKLVRMFCVDHHITYEYLAAKHQAYCEAICLTPYQINCDKGNFRRALVKPNISRVFFEKFWTIMGVTIADMSLSIITSSNVAMDYKLSDSKHMAMREKEKE